VVPRGQIIQGLIGHIKELNLNIVVLPSVVSTVTVVIIISHMKKIRFKIIHSASKHLLSTCYVSGTVWSVGDIAMSGVGGASVMWYFYPYK
jgi:hypothetical protein